MKVSVALTGVKVLNKDNWWPGIVKNARLPAAYKPSVVSWLWSTLKSSSRQNCCTNINNTLSSHSLGGQRMTYHKPPIICIICLFCYFREGGVSPQQNSYETVFHLKLLLLAYSWIIFFSFCLQKIWVGLFVKLMMIRIRMKRQVVSFGLLAEVRSSVYLYP